MYSFNYEFSVNTDGNDNGKLLETWLWYSKDYRYRVFETVSNINLSGSAQMVFYYPLQDYLYLDANPENKTLLDELWKDTAKAQTISVVSTMNIEYDLKKTLKQDAKVGFELTQRACL